MRPSHKLTHALLALGALLMFASAARAANQVSSVDLSITKTGPATIGAGNTINYTIVSTNQSGGRIPVVGATVTDNFPANLTNVTWTCTASAGSSCGAPVGSGNIADTVTLAPQGTVTYSVSAHVSAVSCGNFSNTATVAPPPGLTDSNPENNTATVTTTPIQPNLGPGQCFPAASEISDDKAGSVLIYNIYSSDPSNLNETNTRFNITNTHTSSSVFVHLFFVDGNTCSAADMSLCLTANQTVSFLASDIDPGTTGYLIAVAVGPDGCPISFNFLIGNEFVKLHVGSSREADLGAEACGAEFGSPLPGCDPNSPTVTLPFNGIVGAGYNRLPRTLALDSFPSPADGNNTLLVVNRIGGNLAGGGTGTIGTLFGLLFDDVETGVSWSLSGGCQLRGVLSNNFPRTTPRLSTLIPQGRTGWMKFWAASDVPILGAAINFTESAKTSPSAFNGGHNLHKLTLTATGTLTIPIFPPHCG